MRWLVFILIVACCCGTAAAGELRVPEFMRDVPAGHYAGISSPQSTMHKAKVDAALDVVRQIMGGIRAEYSARYENVVEGRARDPERRVSDVIRGKTSGVVLDVQQHIRRQRFSRGDEGHICFVLVRYPQEKVEEMRRLSRGAHLGAKVVSWKDGELRLRVWEANGVAVRLSEAEVVVRRVNTHADWLSYYVADVPKRDVERRELDVSERLCDSEAMLRLEVPEAGAGITGLLLGTEVSRRVILRGQDVLGRDVVAELGG